MLHVTHTFLDVCVTILKTSAVHFFLWNSTCIFLWNSVSHMYNAPYTYILLVTHMFLDVCITILKTSALYFFLQRSDSTVWDLRIEYSTLRMYLCVWIFCFYEEKTRGRWLLRLAKYMLHITHIFLCVDILNIIYNAYISVYEYILHITYYAYISVYEYFA